jgi:hypothetical protein
MKTWSAFFAGDIFIKTIPEKKLIADDLKAVMAAHDIVSCNFEAPIKVSSDRPIKKAGPALAHEAFAADLVLQEGFNVISLANNHISDYGAEALKRTIKAFDTVLVCGAGENFANTYHAKFRNINGVRIGFVSLAEWGFGCMDGLSGSPGYAWINHPEVDQVITSARKSCDVLIIQAHAGVEEISVPLPEWREKYRHFIRLGADAIIAHHPHVMQGWEIYEGRPVFYSLGNFYFDADLVQPYWDLSYCVSINFEGSSMKEFKVIPVIKTSEGVSLKIHTEGVMEKLCDDLRSPAYENRIDDLCVTLWRDRYQPYYGIALNGFVPGTSLIDALRKIKAWLYPKNSIDRQLLLLHNLRIESHRYCVERALTKLTDV